MCLGAIFSERFDTFEIEQANLGIASLLLLLLTRMNHPISLRHHLTRRQGTNLDDILQRGTLRCHGQDVVQLFTGSHDDRHLSLVHNVLDGIVSEGIVEGDLSFRERKSRSHSN